MTEEVNEQKPIVEKSKKTEKERDWTCLLCGKSYNHNYKYVHSRICMPKKKSFRGPSPKEVKEVAKAVERLEQKVAEKEGTVIPPKLEELPEAKPKLLSNIMEHQEEGDEITENMMDEHSGSKDEVDDIVEDPRINFYLQIAIVIGIVVAALFVGYKAVFNGGQQQQEVVYQEPVDMGFTDNRGVYYGPGEYHH